VQLLQENDFQLLTICVRSNILAGTRNLLR